ncbi:unnamed protein product [Mytilus edulis]|uniref:Uncharacterized protein n=1 Tax=Mytilus edulis TaxID=6550 RepID=A0A8S3TM28_MYTED|nr:unnamed protein product [Mytilus edulis]
MSNIKTYLSTTLKQCQTNYLNHLTSNLDPSTQTRSNIKPYPSTTLKQCQTSKLIQVLQNNVKHQTLSKYYTKQCQTSKLIQCQTFYTLKQCQTSKLIQVLHSNNVKHQTLLDKQCQTQNLLHSNNVKHQTLSKYYTQTMSKTSNLSKCYTQTMSNIKTYPSTTLKQCQTSKLIQVLH